MVGLQAGVLGSRWKFASVGSALVAFDLSHPTSVS